MNGIEDLLGPGWQRVVASLARAVAILGVAWLAARLVRGWLRRTEARLVAEKTRDAPAPGDDVRRAQTLIKLARQVLVVVVWVVAGLMALAEVGVNIAPILAGAGVMGLAVGFGAQNLVRDVISGFFVILEDQVRVGDIVTINGTSGQVEKITLRTIVLRDVQGVVHVFPHGTITTLANGSSGWSGYVVDVGVAYKEDTDRVSEVIRAVAAEMRADEVFGPLMLEDAEVLGVDRFADSAVVIRVRLKTLPLKQWVVGREFNRRLKKAFDREGIEIPFPHVSLYAGEATRPIPVRVVGMEEPARVTPSEKEDGGRGSGVGGPGSGVQQ